MAKRKTRKKRTTTKKKQSNVGDILKKVKPVSEQDDRIVALFYGRSGTGKTTTASTFPKPALLLDIREQGTDSIRDVEGIDILELTEWMELEAVYWALLKADHEYETIIIDTWSGAQNIAIEEVKSQNRMDTDEPLSRRLWGEVSGMMTQWLYHFRDLPMHVVFLAQDRVSKSNEDEDVTEQLDPEVGPAVIPSVSRSLNAAVKIIGQTYIQEKTVRVKTKGGGVKAKQTVSYMMRLGPHPYYTSKMRSPKSFTVPDSIEDPTFDKLIAILKGESYSG